MIWLDIVLITIAIIVFLYKHIEVINLSHQIECLVIDLDEAEKKIEKLTNSLKDKQ